MCNTTEQLHPFQSTRDLDGALGDRETVQDIAFDGETFGFRRVNVSTTLRVRSRTQRERGNERVCV